MAQKKSTPTEIIPAPQSAPLAIQTADALPISVAREITPQVWSMIKEISEVVYRSYGFARGADAAAVLLKGYEVGFGTAASIEFIQSIAGKPPTVSPKGAMALLHRSQVMDKIKITRLTDNKNAFVGYECTMTRKSGFSYTSRFMMEDANRAGLMRPDSGWAKYPENMCLWRSVGFAADVAAPDVVAGMTTLMKAPEMYGVALTEGGDVVDVTPATVNVDPLQELLAQYSAEKILEVYGDMPITPEQIEAARMKLEQEGK
jgi:hypothetical protein